MSLKDKLGEKKFKALLESRYNRLVNRVRGGRLSMEEAEKDMDRIEHILGYVPKVHFTNESLN